MHLLQNELPTQLPNQFTPSSFLFKRDAAISAGIILVALIGGIFLTVFPPLFFVMYRSWKWEKTEKIKAQQGSAAAVEDEGQTLGKAELPAGSSSTIHEMDDPRGAGELSETKDGPAHELPGEVLFPQELPAAIHEMPAGDVSCVLN